MMQLIATDIGSNGSFFRNFFFSKTMLSRSEKIALDCDDMIEYFYKCR